MEKKFFKKIPKCSPEALMNIVADVETYGEFVPLCKEVRIIENLECDESKRKFKASIFIEYKIFKESFVSEVIIDKQNHRIIIKSNDNPFKDLYSEWTFEQFEDDCVVTFFVKVSFRSFMIEKIISLSFDRIAKKVISAFEGRVFDEKLI